MRFAPHAIALPEHEKWGRTINGSRWFKGEPNVVRGKWMCPVPGCGGVMTDTGWRWPMYPAGVHHVCSNEDCGFTAALNERDMELHEIIGGDGG